MVFRETVRILKIGIELSFNIKRRFHANKIRTIKKIR
ncbi:unnamed protein product, partial [marine sediment metagenome]